jgi:zona occludens toxin (predicted ATPase)
MYINTMVKFFLWRSVRVAVKLAILVSIVAVSTFALTDNIDARTGGSDSVVAVSSGSESVGAGFKTAVCGPDAAHACQTSAG